MSYHFPPSELDFIKCKRCYYLKKVKKLEYKGAFPQVFNNFDRDQKNYFIFKNANVLSEKLPKGKFFTTVKCTLILFTVFVSIFIDCSLQQLLRLYK